MNDEYYIQQKKSPFYVAMAWAIRDACLNSPEQYAIISEMEIDIEGKGE